MLLLVSILATSHPDMDTFKVKAKCDDTTLKSILLDTSGGNTRYQGKLHFGSVMTPKRIARKNKRIQIIHFGLLLHIYGVG